MTLYEINKQLEELLDGAIDPETGEVSIDEDALAELHMAKEEKLEGYALYIKNGRAMIEALKAEEAALKKRRQPMENHFNRIESILSKELAGEKFETAKVVCAFRHNQVVSIDPANEAHFKYWASEKHKDFLRQKEPEIDKNAVKRALKSGEDIPFAKLTESVSMTIK